MPFVVVLWDFGLDPLRRGTAAGEQRRLLRRAGAGAVPRPPRRATGSSLGIEAFVVGGRHYLYFPPFPALLRMPLLALTDRLDGRLTAPSMLLAALGARLRPRPPRGRSCAGVVRGGAPVGRGEAFAVGAVIVASVLGGSTLVYLASEPWVYHEVYVWSAAWSVATLAGLVAVWTDRRTRWSTDDRSAGWPRC